MNYTVRSRDTLTSIARRFDTTVSALVQQNHLGNPNALRPGQELNIPGQRDEFTASVTATRIQAQAPVAPAPRAAPVVAAPAPGAAPAPVPSFWERLLSDPMGTLQGGVKELRGIPNRYGAAPAVGQPDVHLTVPFYPQGEAGHGFTPGRRACFRAASQMATDAGGSVTAVGDRIQIATGENRAGRITVDADAAARGRTHIDAELDAGRPVVVGLSHRDARYNADRVTDHFVTITGRTTDADGRTFYTFHDPATRTGADTNERNRFYVDPSNGLLYRPEDYTSVGLVSRRYEVSMVR